MSKSILKRANGLIDRAKINQILVRVKEFYIQKGLNAEIFFFGVLWISLFLLCIPILSLMLIIDITLEIGIIADDPVMVQLMLFVLPIAVYIMDYVSEWRMKVFLRDIMIRVYALYAAIILSISMGSMIIFTLRSIGIDPTLIGGTASIIAVDFILATIIVLSYRGFNRGKVAITWFVLKMKGSILPPYDDKGWHLPPPIQDTDSFEERVIGFAGYTPKSIWEIKEREVSKAFIPLSISCIISFLIVLSISYIEIEHQNMVTTTISPAHLIEPLKGISLINGLPSVAAPLGVKYLNTYGEEALFMIFLIAIPSILLIISAWNFLYVYEERQYRVLRSNSESNRDELFVLLVFNSNLIVIMFFAGLFGEYPKVVFPLVMLIVIYKIID